MDAEENQKQVSLRAHSPWKSLRDSHIPTARLLLLSAQNRFRKEAWRLVASLPPSGSFFDEKMLSDHRFEAAGWGSAIS
jgi:hypothetical protein